MAKIYQCIINTIFLLNAHSSLKGKWNATSKFLYIGMSALPKEPAIKGKSAISFGAEHMLSWTARSIFNSWSRILSLLHEYHETQEVVHVGSSHAEERASDIPVSLHKENI